MGALESLFRKLLSVMPYQARERLELGLEDALATGDPAMVYHRLSELDTNYYGGDLRPPDVEEYYKSYPGKPRIPLPPPVKASGVDALEAITRRRSRRSYVSPIGLRELGSILYYAVGVTGRAWWGGPKRTYPSAGALQPVEAYVSASHVEGLGPGLYHYHPPTHSLETLKKGNYSRTLERIALDQEHVGEAPAVVILTAVYARTASKYGYRSYRYIHWDTGFAGENIYLAAEALGLATVAVGAFYDRQLCRLLDIDCTWEIPMLLFPIGRRP
ncbi:MAG: SagB/ThcOx family dehydrogenase [Desulfurococcales archaeon]|nr:SagB/ThcOx family dehydrogenase [Desulfurococcales archaeon]